MPTIKILLCSLGFILSFSSCTRFVQNESSNDGSLSHKDGQSDYSIDSNRDQILKDSVSVSDKTNDSTIFKDIYLDQNLDIMNDHQTIDTSTDQTIDHPIDQSVDQSIDQPIDQSVDQTIDKPIDSTVDQTIDQKWDTGITTPTVAWAIRVGDSATDRGNDIAIDSNDNILLTGWFYHRSDFGTGTILTNGSADIFLAKYNPSGQIVWVKNFGGSSPDHGMSVDVNKANNNIALIGDFYYSVDFGTGEFTSVDSDSFVATFNSSGNAIWAKTYGADSIFDEGNSIAYGLSGNINTSIDFKGLLDFGTGIKGSYPTATSTGLTQYNSSGVAQWNEILGLPDYVHSTLIATNASGSIALTGGANGSNLNFGAISTGTNQPSVYVARYDNSGKAIWVKIFNATSFENAHNITIDNSNGIIVVGEFGGTINFATASLTSAGGYDAFIVRYDASGNELWAKRYGGTGDDRAYGVTTDSQGNIILTGSFEDICNFGTGNKTSKGLTDIFVLNLDSNGNTRWVKQFGGTEGAAGYSVATDSADSIIVTGSFSGSNNFEIKSLSSAGSSDIFLLKINP